jgi:hypothetical protein
MSNNEREIIAAAHDYLRSALGLPERSPRRFDYYAQRIEEQRRILSEAYQVVGSLLSDLGKFDTPEAEKILDNLSRMRLIHRDVLPWESYEGSQP